MNLDLELKRLERMISLRERKKVAAGRIAETIADLNATLGIEITLVEISGSGVKVQARDGVPMMLKKQAV